MSECPHEQWIPETVSESGYVVWWRCTNCPALKLG